MEVEDTRGGASRYDNTQDKDDTLNTTDEYTTEDMYRDIHFLRNWKKTLPK